MTSLPRSFHMTEETTERAREVIRFRSSSPDFFNPFMYQEYTSTFLSNVSKNQELRCWVWRFPGCAHLSFWQEWHVDEDEYRVLVEWYWQGKTKVLGEKHYIAWVVGEWMGMEHWWNDTDRGNWCTGRETLYSVGGRWMNGYGALVELYWQGKTEVLGEKPFTGTLRSPQISHRLAWDRTWASAVRYQQLATWAIPRSLHTEWPKWLITLNDRRHGGYEWCIRWDAYSQFALCSRHSVVLASCRRAAHDVAGCRKLFV